MLNQKDFSDLRKKLLKAAVPFYEWLKEQQQDSDKSRAAVGHAYQRLAFVRAETGEAEAAMEDYRHMQAIFAKLAADFPTRPELPPGPGHEPQQPGHPARAPRASCRKRRRPTAPPWRSGSNWPPTSPPVPSSARTWPRATTTWASCSRPRAGAGSGGGLRRTPWPSRSNWPPTSPPAPSSARSWPGATTTWATCSVTRAG